MLYICASSKDKTARYRFVMKHNANSPEKKKGFIKWLKRLGFAGFMFFLIKGLVWIAVIYYGSKFTGC